MAAKPLPLPQARPAGVKSVREVRGAKATGVREEMDERAAAGSFTVWTRHLLHETPCWLTSMVVHLVVMLALALLSLSNDAFDEVPLLLATTLPEPDIDELPPLPPQELPKADYERVPATEEATGDVELPPGPVPPTPLPDIPLAERIGPLRDIDPDGLTGFPIGGDGPGLGGGGLGRGIGFRLRRPHPDGKAVAAALKWLAEHQLPDGGWSFDHTLCPNCRGKCGDRGQLDEARVGATALALLPFLGAGQTHEKGDYKTTVRRGLYFLTNRMKLGENGGSFCEPGGRMYSHGLASIVLCEAYAMTRDRGLLPAAQQAVNFICYAQDPVGGGWRYEPQQPGDTSVVGWQIMALKSGHLAYVQVPTATTQAAYRYLDTVQSESGSRYGYTQAGQGSQATTSIGLLCRMYLGWKKDNPALERGVQWLAERGPAENDMYYNYYATQVMRHWGSGPWRKWDAVMKKQLIDTQAKTGHETGSWHFKHSHANQGGRLYNTAMAAMTLEVDYRVLPLYTQGSVEEDFPL